MFTLSMITPVVTNHQRDELSGLAAQIAQCISIDARQEALVEWIVVAADHLADSVAAIVGAGSHDTLTMQRAPIVAPSEWDMPDPPFPVRVITTSDGGGGIAAHIGIGLGAARGAWVWVIEAQDRLCTGAVRHVCDIVTKHDPAYVIGSMVTMSEDIDYPALPALPAGSTKAGDIVHLWPAPESQLEFALPSTIYRTVDLRAAGGWHAALGGLHCLMMQDIAGGGYFTDVNLVRYTADDMRRQDYADWRGVEATLRPQIHRLGLPGGSSKPAWYIKEADPAPHCWPSASTTAPWRSSWQAERTTPHSGWPMLSIITPTMWSPQRLDYFEELADSILSFNLPAGRLEWLIQEDGPNPQALQFLPDNILRHPAVHYRANGVQAGAATTRNMALSRARGVVVLAADDDDRINPDGVYAALEAFNNPGCGYVAGATGTIDSGVVGDTSFTPLGLSGLIGRHGLAIRWANPTNVFPIVHTATLIRRSVLCAAGGWQTLPVGEDIGMLLAVSALSEGFAISDVVMLYRKHADQITKALSNSPVEMQCRAAIWRRALALSGPNPLGTMNTAANDALTQLDKIAGMQTSSWFRNGA